MTGERGTDPLASVLTVEVSSNYIKNYVQNLEECHEAVDTVRIPSQTMSSRKEQERQAVCADPHALGLEHSKGRCVPMATDIEKSSGLGCTEQMPTHSNKSIGNEGKRQTLVTNS